MITRILLAATLAVSAFAVAPASAAPKNTSSTVQVGGKNSSETTQRGSDNYNEDAQFGEVNSNKIKQRGSDANAAFCAQIGSDTADNDCQKDMDDINVK